MARIRSIKPEFCTSRDTARLSRDARLFFLQLLTEADDKGRLVDSSKRLAGVLYPHDDDVAPRHIKKWSDECVAAGMLHRYSVSGSDYLHVANFGKHQVINRASASRLPQCSCEPQDTGPEDSRNGHGALTEPSLPGSGSRNREQGTGSAEQGTGSADAPDEIHSTALVLLPGAAPQAAPVDSVRAVFEAWVQATGRTQNTKLDDKRRRRIKAALAEYPLEDVTDAVRGWQNSPFHTGDNDSRTVHNDLDLLLRDAAHIEKFRDLERNAGTQRPNVPKSWGAIDRALQRRTAAREASNQ